MCVEVTYFFPRLIIAYRTDTANTSPLPIIVYQAGHMSIGGRLILCITKTNTIKTQHYTGTVLLPK